MEGGAKDAMCVDDRKSVEPLYRIDGTKWEEPSDSEEKSADICNISQRLLLDKEEFTMPPETQNKTTMEDLQKQISDLKAALDEKEEKNQAILETVTSLKEEICLGKEDRHKTDMEHYQSMEELKIMVEEQSKELKKVRTTVNKLIKAGERQEVIAMMESTLVWPKYEHACSHISFVQQCERAAKRAISRGIPEDSVAINLIVHIERRVPACRKTFYALLGDTDPPLEETLRLLRLCDPANMSKMTGKSQPVMQQH